MMTWISLRTSDVHIKTGCSVRWRSLWRPLSRGRFLSVAVCAILLSHGCAEPRARPASNPLSTAWPELPAQCHNPDDYIRCARIRRDQALAHRVPIKTAASRALHDCSISCRYPYGPSAFPDSGRMLCCDPERHARCVQSIQDDLIARGIRPASARMRGDFMCFGRSHCDLLPRNPAERDASCADTTDDVPGYHLSLRQYYQSLEPDAAVNQSSPDGH